MTQAPPGRGAGDGTISRHAGPQAITAALVRALVNEQFPEWGGLPVRFVAPGGNDHRTFRLGPRLSVRLPSAAAYVPQVVKEQTWLPRLAPAVPLPIPEVRGVGRPSARFAAPWSVYGWLAGRPAASAPIEDPVRFADDLAAFLVALRSVDATAGPGPGPHSAFRGGPVRHWDEEMRVLLQRVKGRERDAAEGMWRDALTAPFTGSPVWFHGDVAMSNLLTREGRLAAVIDFGCSGVGDPACDTVIHWTYFAGTGRRVFRKGLEVDDATWARGRGWALWKALIMLTNRTPGQAAFARHVLDELMADA
jgi:aminoglycoside phosphotransferase (APT) family kinase protein